MSLTTPVVGVLSAGPFLDGDQQPGAGVAAEDAMLRFLDPVACGTPRASMVRMGGLLSGWAGRDRGRALSPAMRVRARATSYAEEALKAVARRE